VYDSVVLTKTRLKIVQAGDTVLRQEARPLTAEEIRSKEIQTLIELMRETMRDAPGVGLAAPQVGLPIQLAVVEDRAELLKSVDPERLAERGRAPVPFHGVINPVMTLDGAGATFFEGCLSVQGYSALVPRALDVTVDCLDERGDDVRISAHGWHARILQHEIDHMNGVLYVDRMITRSLTTVEQYGRYWNSLAIADVMEAFGLTR
jgi:peptide deformylase